MIDVLRLASSMAMSGCVTAVEGGTASRQSGCIGRPLSADADDAFGRSCRRSTSVCCNATSGRCRCMNDYDQLLSPVRRNDGGSCGITGSRG